MMQLESSEPLNNKKEKSYSHHIRIEKTYKTIICILLCLLSLIPFILLFCNSTRSSNEIKQGISLLPGKFLKTNWQALLDKQNGMQITIQKSMINSLIIAVPSTLLSVYFSSLTAYGIHAYNFKGKKFVWAFILAIMMVPSQVSAIGFYKFMIQIGLNDNFLPLIIPATAAPAVLFFMKQYMQSSLSLEIVEAARIDGAGEFRTFNTIVVPLMKPAIATQAIFNFVASWNNLFMPTMILTSEQKKTLPMFVQLLTSDQFKVDYGMVYVGIFVAIIPLFVVYFILSKYIIAGIALGGVKE